jgi:hypothetical protein
MKLIKILGLSLATAGLMSLTASAVPITGSIGFTGTYTQNGGTLGILNTATSMSITGVGVDTSSGSLAGATAPLSFITPIDVNPNGPLPALTGATLWSVTVGGEVFTFTINSATQVYSDASQINIQGSGIMNDSGAAIGLDLEATAGTFQLGFGRSGTAFTWQSTSAANVPDGGTTVILLGAALAGLTLVRRRFSA